jgi:CO dehydrogenase maturation factor
MKIAVVGKGGSGKSSVSWLLSNYFAKQNRVLAIDEDFNMDLTAQLGIEFDRSKFIYRNHDFFRDLFQMKKGDKWFDLYKKTDWQSYSMQSDFIDTLTVSVTDTLRLMVTGIGDEDAVKTGKCGHSHSAPIKFLLPNILLNSNEYIIIDSVAGVDMLMYGLYQGCDVAFICVENLPSSIKVAKQIAQMCNKVNLPFRYIQTKYDNETIPDLEIHTIAQIPLDKNIVKSKYHELSNETISALQQLSKSIETMQLSSADLWKRLLEYDLEKTSIKQHLAI